MHKNSEQLLDWPFTWCLLEALCIKTSNLSCLQVNQWDQWTLILAINQLHVNQWNQWTLILAINNHSNWLAIAVFLHMTYHLSPDVTLFSDYLVTHFRQTSL